MTTKPGRPGGPPLIRDVRSLLLAVALLAAAGAGAVAPAAADEGGERVLELDFPAVHIGVAEYDEGPTGATVFYFPEGVIAAADVRGGSPGTINVPAVQLGYEESFIDAVVFSGGSWYGLSAATGVADEIGRIERAAGEDAIPGVLGAIIYDLGGRRPSRVTPDAELGARALRAAEPGRFPLGARGAGRLAMQGAYFHRGERAADWAAWAHSGQGAAFGQVGPTKVAVFTVVNSMGSVVDRDGRVVRCHRNLPRTDCPQIADLIAETLADRAPQSTSPGGGPTGNTTLTLVVTNQKMPWADLQRLAAQVHTSMARAIQPFATEHDGDVLYAVTTSEIENPDLGTLDLGVLASELAWDAALASMPELPSPPALLPESPDPSTLRPSAGSYVFPDGSRLRVELAGDTLTVSFTRGRNRHNLYFDEGGTVDLLPAVDGSFVIDDAAHDVVRFDTGPDGATGLTINPGPWAITARREGGEAER